MTTSTTTMKCKVKTCLLVLTGLVLFSRTALSDPAVLFRMKGNVYAVSSVVHAELEVDLKEYIGACKRLDNYGNEIEQLFIQHKQKEGAIAARAKALFNIVRYRIRETCQVPRLLDQLIKNFNVRNKRQIVVGLLGLAGGAIMATILGLFGADQVEKDKQKQEKWQNQALDTDYLLLSRHEARQHELTRSTEVMDAAMMNLLKAMKKRFNEEDLMHNVNTLDQFARVTEHFVNGLVNGLTQLTNHKLSLDLLNAPYLESLWIKINSKARKAGNLIFNNPFDLLQIPATYAVNPEGILKIFIHVPLAHSTLRLYNYKSFPINFKGNESDMNVIISQPQMKTHLAVNDMSDRHVELSVDQLESECWRFNSHYVCDEMNLFRKHMTTSCLGSLYTNKVPSIQKLCNIEEFKPDWQAERLNEDQYLVFAKSSTNIITKCLNGSVASVSFRGYQKVNIGPSCTATSEEFSITPTSLSRLAKTVFYRVKWAPEHILPGKTTPDDFALIKRQLIEAEVEPEEDLKGMLKQREYLRLKGLLNNSQHTQITLTTLVILAVVIIVLITCACSLKANFKSIIQHSAMPLQEVKS